MPDSTKASRRNPHKTQTKIDQILVPRLPYAPTFPIKIFSAHQIKEKEKRSKNLSFIGSGRWNNKILFMKFNCVLMENDGKKELSQFISTLLFSAWSRRTFFSFLCSVLTDICIALRVGYKPSRHATWLLAHVFWRRRKVDTRNQQVKPPRNDDETQFFSYGNKTSRKVTCQWWKENSRIDAVAVRESHKTLIEHTICRSGMLLDWPNPDNSNLLPKSFCASEWKLTTWDSI